MTPELKVAVIDMDETLISSKEFIVEFLKGAFAYLNRPFPSEVEDRAFSMDERTFIKTYFNDPGEMAKLLEYKAKVMDERGWVRFPKKPGADEFLERATSRWSLALATNRAESSESVLEAYGWDHHFDLVLHAENFPHSKPDRRVIGHIMETLGATPDETVMVGDSPFDADAAKNAGVLSILVGDDDSGDFRVSSLMEALKLLENWAETWKTGRENR